MQRHSFRYFLLIALVVLGGVAVAACTAVSDPSILTGSSSSGSSSGSSTAQGGFTGVGGSNTGGLGIGNTGGGCSYKCSADLKKVLGCNGELIQECPADQACLNGTCSDDPCGAAEASKSSYGCDYWVMRPDLITDGKGACFAAYVANTWDAPVKIKLSFSGTDLPNTGFIQIPKGQGQSLSFQPYDDNAGLPVGEVAIIFLSHENPPVTSLPICPVAAAVNGETAVSGTARGNAFNIVTDRPIVAYSILPYGGGPSAATSASLLLPTSAWDTNYVAVNAYPKSQIVAQAAPSLRILAIENNTEVTILPKVAIGGGQGVAGSAANTPVTYTLARSEFVQISQDQELTGSPIQSNKPVGVWGGASCLNVPVGAAACDSAHQQIPPVKALGSTYAGVRYRNRSEALSEEAPPWRIVGAVNSTQLSWTPSMPPGAPAALNLGDVFEFNHAGPFVVKSQDAEHPFYIAQYMTGAQHIGSFGGEGDPEWVNIVPIEQFMDKYIFFTDPTYSETNLVVVRRKSTVSNNFVDVHLKCSGALGNWQAIGDYEYTRVDLVTGNFQDVGGCSNGRQEMWSDAPFGVTVWGWGTPSAVPSTTYVSYAYPAGASVLPINEVVVPPVPK